MFLSLRGNCSPSASRQHAHQQVHPSPTVKLLRGMEEADVAAECSWLRHPSDQHSNAVSSEPAATVPFTTLRESSASLTTFQARVAQRSRLYALVLFVGLICVLLLSMRKEVDHSGPINVSIQLPLEVESEFESTPAAASPSSMEMARKVMMIPSHQSRYPCLQPAFNDHMPMLYQMAYDFDAVFDAANIHYVIAEGTLIGANRHHGIIP
jgi:hypothetical protein